MNWMKKLLLGAFIMAAPLSFSQTYPIFGNEIPVTINGLTFDAMEPTISADGNYMFFNSLNDGIATSLYYAAKVNDSVFTFVGPLSGANESISPRLDAVSSSDSANDFYWVSLRDFPTQFDNYFHGTFNGTDVVNIGRVHGNFYVYSLGWLIMDAAINYSGSLLYYCNAYFNTNYSGCGTGIPCLARLGVAQKLNDSTFAKLSNSDSLMKNINDTNYIVYAPFVTKDGLELYYTRALHNATQTEVCVAVRTTVSDTFSLPAVIYASPLIPEAPTFTTDNSRLYYHKSAGGVYKLFMRYKTSSSGIREASFTPSISIFPNPASTTLNIYLTQASQTANLLIITDILGNEIHVQSISNSTPSTIDISTWNAGVYFYELRSKTGSERGKFVKSN